MNDFPPRPVTPGLTLGPGEIDVWRVRLDLEEDRVERLGRLLTPDEWERANRFRFDKHRRQYVVGRGALRTLLGAYLGTRPELVRFTYGPRGKPFLAPPHDASGLQFNLSNSDEMALAGFIRGVEIGVDVEYLKPMP
ncbi:MAG TPA: 4'-phosphopantetheinyl transferase, partial [Thermoanaerobaculia bacterium]|nr:4'-phosphopantetheinyl transferase [Thermoanaerobaculia bacterium]